MSKPENPPKRTGKLKRWMRVILLMVGFTFFVGMLIRYWESTQQAIANADWWLLGLSVIVALANSSVMALVFQALLGKYGFLLSFRTVGQMFFFGQVAKYTPGRVWSVLYQITFVQEEGATSALFYSNFDLMFYALARTILISIALLTWASYPAVSVLAFATCAILLIQQGKSSWLQNVATKIFPRLSRHQRPDIKKNHASPVRMFILNLGTWCGFIAANFLMLRATFGFSFAEAMPYVAYNGLAWVAGVLVLVAPAGIGVREGLFVFLASYLPDSNPEVIVSIAVISRFWATLHELAGVVFASVLRGMHPMK